MEKSKKNKAKDRKNTKGKIWVEDHVRYSKRSSGSGMRFEGHYEDIVRGGK